MKHNYFFKLLFTAAVFIALAASASAQNELFYCDFSVANQGYSTGTVTSTQYINGEAIPIHQQTAYHSRWQRLADTAMSSISYSNYPVFAEVFPSWLGYLESNTADQGVMFMTMCDQIASWGGTGTTGKFDAYIAFPAFSTVGVSMIKVNFYQLYLCFNNDKCWIDYSTDNVNWSAVEINVRNIDVNSNGSLLGWKSTILPVSLGNQSNVYLRLRWSSENTTGGAYGYFWLVDDFSVTVVPQYDMQTMANNIWGAYGTIPQGMQLPLTYVSQIKNMGSSALSNTTANIYADGTLMGQDVVSVPILSSKYAIVDRSGFYTDTTLWYGNPRYGAYQYYGGTTGTLYNGGMMPSATAGSHTLSAFTTMPGGLSTDTLQWQYTVDGSTGDRVWAWDNGTMYYGDYALAGSNSDGFVANNPEDAGAGYEGYSYHVRYRTGDVIPEGWVIRGMQIVTSSEYTQAGAMFNPFLAYDSNFVTESGNSVTFVSIPTGAQTYTVASGDLNADAVHVWGDGVTSYNVIQVMFPSQPELQPNTSYRLGYQMANNYDFLPAVDNSTTYGMGQYDAIGGYYGYSWRQPGRRPMIRMIVGPAEEPYRSGDTLFYCDFSVPNQYYSTGTVTTTQYVNGEAIPIHQQTAYHSRWQRIGSYTDTILSDVYYPASFDGWYSWPFRPNRYEDSSLNAISGDAGIMLMTMQDQIAEWGGHGTTGNFDAYIAFPPFSTMDVDGIRVKFYQYYRCFNNDKCWIDYSTDGVNWSSLEINVRSVDVNVNSTVQGWKSVNLPIALGNQPTVYLRLRWSCDNNAGGAYGYVWAVDDFFVIPIPDYDYRTTSNAIRGAYGMVPQGLQLPATYVSRITNMGMQTLAGTTARLYADGNLLGQDVVSVPFAQTKYAIVDASGFYTDTTYWNNNPENGGFNYYGGTFGTIYNNGLIPSVTVGQHTLTAVTSMPGGLHTDTINMSYTVGATVGTDYVWAWDNGNMLYGSYYCYGQNTTGYNSDNPEEIGYDQPGFMMNVRYRTGQTVPTGWVVRGMQIVASSELTEAGAIISPVLFEDSSYYDGPNATLSRRTLSTGAASHTVTANETNQNGNYITGDVVSNYNVITMMFPEQPELKPNMMYRVGYEVVNGSFMPAVDDEIYGGMGAYDFQSGFYGVRWSNPTRRPMIRLLVGPAQFVPKTAVAFNCPTGYNLQISRSNNAIACGAIDSVVLGSTVTYTVYPESGMSLDFYNVYVNGSPVPFDTYSQYDEYGNEFTFIEFTLSNVTTPQSVSFSVSEPLSYPTVNGPATVFAGDTATFWASLTHPATLTWTVQGTTAMVDANDPALVRAVWNAAGTYSVVATTTTTSGSVSDTLWVNVFSCDPITTFPYTMGFEQNEPVNCWQNYGNISTDYGVWSQWYWSQGDAVAYNGFGSLGSLVGGGSVDNWLVSPVLELPADAVASLSWYDFVYSENSGSVYNVKVYNETAQTWSTVANYSYTDDDWQQRSVDLSAYAGQSIRFAFNHSASGNNYSYVMVDDITVSASQPVAVTVSCSGDGTGVVYKSADYGNNRCGEEDYYPMGFTASYDFIPGQGSQLTALYVNNVDRINEVWTNSSASSASTRCFSFAANTSTSIQAVFSRITYQVVATSNNAAMGTATGGGTYYYDSTATVEAIPLAHYHFTHWMVTLPDYPGVSVQVDDNPFSFPVAANYNFEAYFEADVYTVTVQPNDPAWGTVSGGGEFEYLQPVSLTATALDGYHFVRWSNGMTYNPYTFPATADVDLTAIFASDEDSTQYFTITAESEDADMGVVTGGGLFAEGDTVTLTAEAFEGFHFVQWHDGNSDNPRQVVAVADTTYIAYFVSDEGEVFSITVVANNPEWGIVAGGGEYEAGSEAVITATPYSGYFFIRWDDGDTANPRTVTVLGDATYTAIFDTVENVGIWSADGESASFAIYPNPASESVTIALAGVDGSATVTIIDLGGRVVGEYAAGQHASSRAGQQSLTIDLTGFAKGAYFVRVVSNGGSSVQKLIVK